MENTTAGGFIVYPTNRVAGTITEADGAKRAVEDLVAAYYCALDPATPMRVRGVLLARPESKQWLLQLTLLALACSAD